MFAKAQPQPAATYDQAGCQIDQFLDYRFNPASLAWVSHRRLLSQQAELAYEPQNIVGKGPK